MATNGVLMALKMKVSFQLKKKKIYGFMTRAESVKNTTGISSLTETRLPQNTLGSSAFRDGKYLLKEGLHNRYNRILCYNKILRQ
jgi:hypothetical protein